ncbi:MAG TPA: hypothetical protein VLW85_03105 [Myxococcales bacterium]|nr:hypothetical protein [Myxococcales bacterium]
MRRRVFVIGGEYSANPRHLVPERRKRDFFAVARPEPTPEEVARSFFRYPNRGDEGRARPADWERAFGIAHPIGLTDLFASAAHRALTSLHTLLGGEYRRTRDRISDLYVTSMPGLTTGEPLNIGLVPQALRALLGLSPRTRAQFIVGTSDSGAWTFTQAVRAARNAEHPATILVVAGQIIPSGYVSQYQIRSVLGDLDQSHGLDMLAVGDLLMDVFRRNLGLRRDELDDFLTRVSARKHQTGALYPAGIHSGKPFRRDARRTPYFDASDIAAPCCGAAATIVTSDETLVEAMAQTRNPRYRTAPVTEVLGAGEGSSNQNLISRKSPLVFATAVRDALADTADDAHLPISTFGSCAFGVVHDAFASIELSFLLAMGLPWEVARERMVEGWSNPVGGLLSFGHALGASGLVQVNKAHHLFCVDSRYLVEGRKRQGFREDGALAFTTSVGGPLSHVVGVLLRGGYQELPPVRQRRPTAEPTAPLSHEWRRKRYQLRLVLPSYLHGLEREEPASPATGGARMRGALETASLVEGVTWVSIRSCLRALSPADIARLGFDGIDELVAPSALPGLRARLRNAIHVAQQESDRLQSMFDVFRLLTDEMREIATECRQRGTLSPKAAALSDEKLTDLLKECLRAPLAMVCRPGGRELIFSPGPELAEAELVSAEGAPLPAEPVQLPFWNARATRPAAPAPSDAPAATVSAMIDALVSRAGGPRTAAELELLRLWFSADAPRALLDRAVAGAGAAAPIATKVKAVFAMCEIADAGILVDTEAAHELLGRAAREARAYLEAYESNVVQVGSTLFAVAFERPPFRASSEEPLLSAARFALELARGAQGYGVAVRAAACSGEGTLFEDLAGRPAVSSPAAACAAEVLQRLRAERRPSIALVGASPLLVTLIGHRLAGWERAPDAGGAAVWLGR